MLPNRLRRKIPPRQKRSPVNPARHNRRVLLLPGCVQSAVTPNTNAAATRLLDTLGIEAVEPGVAGCCGAAASHTSMPDLGRAQARQLIDACWPAIESGVEAIVGTASGCNVNIKDYGRMFANEPDYAAKAARFGELFCDLLEIIEPESERLTQVRQPRRLALHTPCTLQHGLGLNGRLDSLLRRVGHELCAVRDSHLCCGSAGTYSILQSALSQQLQQRKLEAFSADKPELIVTANVGCQLHLASGSDLPVRHWTELMID